MDKENKITFYNLGSQRTTFSKYSNVKNYEEGPIRVSNDFNKALNKVLDKDISFLSNKINEITNEIQKYLVERGFFIKFNNISLENIDSIINFIEAKVSELIIEKGNNKIGVFTTRKNEKKLRNIKIDECVDYLSKSMTDLISMKNEFNNLSKKKTNVSFDEKNEEENKEDPLERTISFYINKEKV